ILLPVDLWPETPNPVKDWTYHPLAESRTFHRAPSTNHLDQDIIDDYKIFLAKEYPDVSSAVTGYYEDGKGRRAILFNRFKGSDSWSYAVIYDDKNKRIRVVKFGHRRSSC